MPYKSEGSAHESVGAGADLLLSLTKKSVVTPRSTMYTKGLHSPIKTSSFTDWSPSSVSNILKNPLEKSPERPQRDEEAEEDRALIVPQGRKRIISPSSSNERPEDEESVKTQQKQQQQQQQHPVSQPWGPQYHYPYPPNFPQPPNSFRGFPGYPAPTHPWPMYAPPPPPTPSHQFYDDANDSTATNMNRCIPLKPPIATRFWGAGNSMMNQKLPDFARIVNFPDYLARGRHADKSTDEKHCVMCGKMRSCKTSTKKEAADNHHIIPKQNKGVCTRCDVAVWMFVELNLEIKWCKGCKNFKYWVDFGDKGLATKCIKCRTRQKEKYFAQKQLHK